MLPSLSQKLNEILQLEIQKKKKKPNCREMESFSHERDSGMFGGNHSASSSFLGLFRQFLLHLVPSRGNLSSVPFVLLFSPK